MTMQETFATWLNRHGERLVRETRRYQVWTRTHRPGTYYFLGTHGSLRIGVNRTTSRPASDAAKQLMLEGGGA